LRSYEIAGAPAYAFTFCAQQIPNVGIGAVAFNGATYEEPQGSADVRLDTDARRLSVEVRPDRERYRPGETATLNVRVRGPGGKPERAEVLLGAVDEALSRLQGQSFFEDLGILDSLYESVSTGILQTYRSHVSPEALAAGAEFGGEGGARMDFRDVALFDRVETSGDGTARVPFKLPDNLTSWRVSALAVTDGLFAGSSVTLVPVGLPLFADVALNDTYLESDEVRVRARAFGEGLRPGDPVTFTVRAPSLGGEAVTLRGKAFEPADAALLRLRAGTHEIRVTVDAGGGRSDTIVRSIRVVKSRLLRAESSYAEVRPGGAFAARPAPAGRTRLVLTDHNRGRHYASLLGLTATYGDRVDQMLARALAQELLAKYYRDVWLDFPTAFRASTYQTGDGGIAIFPFADDDLVLSARVSALAPDRFDRARLLRFFEAVEVDVKETRERQVVALYGRAALGAPVLEDVQFLAGLRDLTPRERAYTGLAAVEAGDEETARRVYRGLLEQYGEQRGPEARLRVGRDQDGVLEMTSLAAILGASLGDDLAPMLFDYTIGEPATDLLVALEQISYLSIALPSLSADPVRFGYTLEGKRVAGQLERGESMSLSLLPDQVRALDLAVTSGTLGAVTSFDAPLDPASIRRDPDVRVSRTYPGQSGSRVTVDEGDLIKITLRYLLSPQAAAGCYQLTDLVPSGLRPVTPLLTRTSEVAEGEVIAYPYSIVSQRVSFCVSREDTRTQLVYFARAIGTGTYLAEPAVLQSEKVPSSIDLTGSTTVVVR
jgi:hypothetical protein